MSGEASWSPEVLRAGGGVSVEVETSGGGNLHVYKDARRLAQTKVYRV